MALLTLADSPPLYPAWSGLVHTAGHQGKDCLFVPWSLRFRQRLESCRARNLFALFISLATHVIHLFPLYNFLVFQSACLIRISSLA